MGTYPELSCSHLGVLRTSTPTQLFLGFLFLQLRRECRELDSPEQGKDAVPRVSKCSICVSTRFFRELTELKTFANYSTCDRSNLADWLGGIEPKFRQYTYNLLTCGIDRNFLHRVTEQQLQEDCNIHTGFHRVRILTAARGAPPGPGRAARGSSGWAAGWSLTPGRCFALSRNAALAHHAANRGRRDRCVHQLPQEHGLAAGQVSPAGDRRGQREGGWSAVGEVWNGEEGEAAKSCRKKRGQHTR